MMLYICVGVIAMVAGLEIAGYFALCGEKPKGVLYCGCLVALLKNKILKCINPRIYKESRSYYEKVHIGKDYRESLFLEEGKILGLAFMVMGAISIVLLLGEASGAFSERYIKKLDRPKNGSSYVELQAEYDGQEHIIEMKLTGPELTEGEKDEAFKEVCDSLDKLVLGDNESLKQVTKRLNFKDSFTKAGVRAIYQSSNYRVIDSSGNVYSDEIYENTQVVVTVTLSLGERELERKLFITACPASKEAKDKNLIINALDYAEGDEKSIYLPENIEGKSVRFKTSEKSTEYILMVLGAVSVILVLLYGIQKKRDGLKLRRDELICDYPELVSKLSLLLEAGLTVRLAFERIAEDYLRKNTKEKRYVFEEMAKTCNELSLGISEKRAYETFGLRCGTLSYLRLSQLLVQSVRKGGESLITALRKEMLEALKDKKEAIKKKGEEIRVKLLIPMMGLLTVILGIIMIPAILNF